MQDNTQHIIDIEHLDKSFGDVHAVNDLSFHVKQGELFAFLGVNGAGKSTLIRSILGQQAYTGQITFHTAGGAQQKLRIGYVPEDRLTEGLCMHQSIADNITLASLKRLCHALGTIRRSEILADANRWVDKFAIKTDNAHKHASTLSGGNQQKIVLSKWLCNDLDVLILNGPTVGVDVGAKQDIHHLVHELANEGLAVIIISDDLSEVVVNCSRVLVMKGGKLVAEMKDDAITEDNILEIIR